MTSRNPLGKISFFFLWPRAKRTKSRSIWGYSKVSRNYSKELVKLVVQVYIAHLNWILLNMLFSFVLKCDDLNHLIGAFSPRPH